MRFKIYYNEQVQKIKVNVLRDSSNNVTSIPEPSSSDQHVYFPIPNEYQLDLLNLANDIITDDMNEKMEKINNDIKTLLEERNALINNIRTEKNPEIIKICKQFRDERAEEFI